MLIGANGKSFQLNLPGTFSFTKLQQLISSAGVTNVSQKYFKYVYENLFNVAKGDKLSITPVVYRDEVLMKYPTDKTILLATKCAFTWKKPANENWVRLQVRNNGVIIYDSVFKKKTGILIDFSKLPGSSTWYQWHVEEAGVKQHSDIWNQFLIPARSSWESVRSDLRLLNDNRFNKETKDQIRTDLFEKWKNSDPMK